MSRHSLARALLSILVALFLSSTVTSAEAKPYGWGEKYGPLEGAVGRGGQDERPSLVLRNWTICRNGAKFTIAADRSVGPRLELIVRSPTQPWSGRERVVWQNPEGLIRLEDKPLSIRYFWWRKEAPTSGSRDRRAYRRAVMRDSPNRPPKIIPRTRYRYSTTVKLLWRLPRLPPAGTVRLSMGPAGRYLEPGILRVRNCLLLGGGFQLG
jgi:hypothetical protein